MRLGKEKICKKACSNIEMRFVNNESKYGKKQREAEFKMAVNKLEMEKDGTHP